MLKYLISYWIEKLHRYCFDIIYVQNYVIKIKDKIILIIFDLCQRLVPDYREYLNKWHLDETPKYFRYKTYGW